MDILNRLGIDNRTTKRTKFAEFYSLKKDIKSNSVAIENYNIANSINDLISHRMSPRGEASNGKESFLNKAKNGATNIINKILAFLKRVKDYIMKKFRQFKEFIFGKKADKVQNATEASTTIISEVIKKNGVVPTNMPNNAWEYMKMQRSDANKAGQDLSDAKDDMKDSINKRHNDANDYIKKAFSKIFGNSIPKTVEVETIDIPKILLIKGPSLIMDEDVTNEIQEIMKYLQILRYDSLVKNGPLRQLARSVNTDKFGKNQLRDLLQSVGPAWAKVINKFNNYTLSFSKNMERTSVPVSDKERLKVVTNKISEIKENISVIKNMFSDIDNNLTKYYDVSMKKMKELKKELSGNTNFKELYRDIIDLNNILTGSNDKLLKEAEQLIKSYDKLLSSITVKIK